MGSGNSGMTIAHLVFLIAQNKEILPQMVGTLYKGILLEQTEALNRELLALSGRTYGEFFVEEIRVLIAEHSLLGE